MAAPGLPYSFNITVGIIPFSLKENAENAVILGELSSTSIAHLRTAQVKVIDGTSKAISALNNGFEQDVCTFTIHNIDNG
jgi:hypothetical protein